MKITIITPSHNSEKSIEKTILSILRQKKTNIQYIIVDGGSTDNTLDIIAKYRNKIDILISEKDKGIADAYNKGIKLASGELIGIVAADDQLINFALDKLMNLYDGRSDVISGNLIEFNGERYLRRYSDSNLDKLTIQTSLIHPATFIRKDAYLKYGLYSLQYKCAIDRELFLRFYKNGATFQIIDSDISFFNTGGISTATPTKYSYPEDAQISIKYGASIFRAKSYQFKALVLYYSYTLIKKILKLFHLKTYFNDKMIQMGYYIPCDQIKKLKLL